MAEQYSYAHNKTLSIKTRASKVDVKDTKPAGPGSQRDIRRCFACNSRRHRAVKCFGKAYTFRNELNIRFCRIYCDKCESKARIAEICRRPPSHASTMKKTKYYLQLSSDSTSCLCYASVKEDRRKGG